MKLYLASGSPRRKQMLEDLRLQFNVLKPDVEEIPGKLESPLGYVKRLAREKAAKVLDSLENPAHAYVLAADTIVVHKNRILEKPRNAAHALEMLTRLSGDTHVVFTSWCWMGERNFKVGFEKTFVEFEEMDKKFWKWYISTKEPMDKAGAYAAQGIGMSFIKAVRGSYSNVVGLPLPQVVEGFKNAFNKDLLKLFQK